MTGTRPSAVWVVLLAAVAYFASGPGQSFLIAVFNDDLIADATTSRTAFSSLYALATVASALTVLVIGKAIDQRGTPFVWVVISLGLIAGCLTLSWAPRVRSSSFWLSA